MVAPYWQEGDQALYLGDCRELLPQLAPVAACVVADPPYTLTSLTWDQWPQGWLTTVSRVSSALWCFGTLRMYLRRAAEFADAGWQLSHDVIWEKHNGSKPARRDRFLGVHEQLSHWYRGAWDDVPHQVPLTPDAVARTVRRRISPAHTGAFPAGSYASVQGGPKLARSVLPIRSAHHDAVHPTQKPLLLIRLLLEYSCPAGSLVVDPFAGSGVTLAAARDLGLSGIGIEADERCAERAALRLSASLI